jgi:alpha-glucosidase
MISVRKNMNIKKLTTGLCLCGVVAVTQASDSARTLKSPDGNIAVKITAGDHLRYTVTFHGKTVVESSALGVTMDGRDLGQGAVFAGKSKTAEINESYPVLGVHKTAVNHCLSTALSLTSGTAPWQLEVRVFNDGLGYRYVVPGDGVRHVNGESSGWKLQTGSEIWSQSATNTSYESRYEPAIVGQQPKNLKIMAPATVKFANGAGYGVMTEANLIHYSDLSLSVDGNDFKAFFRNNRQGWDATGEVVSPWRVTILAADLNALVNSDIIKNLCPPPSPELADAPWIRPGRSAWGWLSCYCGPKLDDQKAWIDRTKALGFEYYLIDDGWRDWNGGGDNAWNAMAGVVSYAKEQGVGVWAWVHCDYVHKPGDRMAYFKRAKSLGIVGLKIDFPRPADVEWVDWYEDASRDAASLQLLVDFHGAVKPTGRERTWPNELTREAIAGREQGKNPATHDTTLPFLRYVQGHADYTPTLFIPGRLNGSSYAHELAMAVVFTSPFLCLGDNPINYLNSAAVDVIKALPPVWDETVVLPGSEIGGQAIFARRHGNEWFIGAINGQMPRRVDISLGFLGKGSFKLVELADDPERNDGFVRTERTVTAKDRLTLPLRKDGGYVAFLVGSLPENQTDQIKQITR